MSRAALILAFLCAAAAPLAAQDPHVDPAHVPGGCPACHAGHGAPGSPMLAATQREVCLGCHGTQAKADEQIRRGHLAATSRPELIGTNLALPFTHPAGEHAFSARQPGEVACTSCHSPHRGSLSRLVGAGRSPGRRISTRDPAQLEFEMCQDCHGNQGVTSQDRRDLSRLLNPNSRSYHPVEAPATSRSPSLPSDLTGMVINCTDCHGNSDANGPRGIHGSGVRYLLNREYTTTDGAPESPGTYALCYDCHDRDAVLDSQRFPQHRLHVSSAMLTCASCHDPHGSPDQRALIRIAEDTTLSGITPSVSTGVLAFESMVPGSGSCFLTCHGFDHAPENYGAAPPAGRRGGPDQRRIPAAKPLRR